MKHPNLDRRQRRLMIGGGTLAAALLLCVWLFGWGRGSINVIDFSADEVDHVRLSCAQLYNQGAAVVKDPEEIQALIDSANAFQDTGNNVKNIFRYRVFAGGSMLHEYAFFLSNGDEFIVTFSSNEGEPPVSDMKLTYWVTLPNGERRTGGTCRGSLRCSMRCTRNTSPIE